MVDKSKQQTWRHYRVDCILAIIDQAKFIKNAAELGCSDKTMIKYINELEEMVLVLKRFAKEI